MVGLMYDCLNNPLGAVRLTFEKAVASGSDSVVLDGKDWGATEVFRQFLFDDGWISKVPLLSPSTIKWVQPNTLVRFRGMIQDMLGNEYYVGAYKDSDKWRTNKFADASRFPMDSSTDQQLWERRLLYCVPVPGQNSWIETPQEAVKSYYADSSSPTREKRPRDEDHATLGDVDMDQSQNAIDEDSPNSKKMRENGSAPRSNSQMIVTDGSCSGSCLGQGIGKDPFSCLVKVYDSPESELKLNDVIEFVGILTFDPDLALTGDVNDELIGDFCEDAVFDLPPAKVPRLHCVAHRKLTVGDFLTSPQFEITPSTVKEVRESLVGYFASVLGNDRVAAQYLLLHLLSRVQARVDSIAIGKLSLNLTCFNRETTSVFGNHLKHAIQNVLPFTQWLTLTVDYLNTNSLAPKKDYKTNRLVSGALQLAESSHLTIDETMLQSGTLNSTGCENTRILKNMMESQTVEYDFTYYKMEMAADIQLLILSEGKSNILPADLVVPLCPSSVNSSLEASEEMVKAWRWYLGTMKSLPHSIEAEMQKVVEEDLVVARRSDRTLGSDEMSKWVTMGRLMSASYGERSLTEEHWEMVKELESMRKERARGNM